jgi:hypothetical protein
MKTHKTPLVCIIRAKIVPKSPSALLFKCSLGLNRHAYTKCKGCENNIAEKICRAIKEGLEKGLKEGAKNAKNIEYIKNCEAGFDSMPGNKEQ